MNTQTPAIGTPVQNPGGAEGFIARIIPAESGRFSLSGGMQQIKSDYEIVYADDVRNVPDTIAENWIRWAAGRPMVPESEIESRRAAALAAKAAARQTAITAQEEAAARRAAFRIEAAAKMPADAKAVILAELLQDDSDSMSDYWNSKTTRIVILGFSTHTRDLFPELRKAALNFPETADLFAAPADAEHREKYSMGAGYYLKTGTRHSDGWRVSKSKLYNGADSIPVGEWFLSPPAAAPAASSPAVAPAAGRFTISEHTHTKGSFQMWIAALSERVDRAEYDSLLADAKARGGWYSRAWGNSPAGFAFKSETAAREFAGVITEPAPAAVSPAAGAAPRVKASASTAAKLRALADKLDSDIADKFRDRLTNTPKRQREAQSARLDGQRLKRTQEALRALADHHESGTVPVELMGATTKAAVSDLCRAEIISTGGYYDAGRETGKPAKDTPATRALWSMLAGETEAEKKAADLRHRSESLQFANIPGYFPTPAAIVARMIEAADIPAGGCLVLEPEGGSAAILDGVRAAAPACEFIVYERHSTLAEIIRAKGYPLTGSDFTESDLSLKVARVLMNPPFENGQDAAHVMRAFEHLETGGRLVAIMSPGPFYRSDSKAVAFRAWFGAHGGTREDLPAGAFKESGTGVATVLITIDR